jgi:hypothetical protein
MVRWYTVARQGVKAAPAKAAKPEGAGVLFVRDPVLAGELDAWAAVLNAANPDAPAWSRTSLARAALRRALRERGAKSEAP